MQNQIQMNDPFNTEGKKKEKEKGKKKLMGGMNNLTRIEWEVSV